MNSNDIQEMREKNEKLLNVMEEDLKKRNRYEELLKNPLIKEFLSLENYKGFEPMDENKRIDTIIPTSIKRQHSNQIYIDQGTWVRAKTMYSNDILTFPDDAKADYKAYRDLETGEAENIQMEDIKVFENEYLVIHMPEKDFIFSSTYNKNYYKLRRWFFKELLVRPQHEVVKSLMDSETIEEIFKEQDSVSLNRKMK